MHAPVLPPEAAFEGHVSAIKNFPKEFFSRIKLSGYSGGGLVGSFYVTATFLSFCFISLRISFIGSQDSLCAYLEDRFR